MTDNVQEWTSNPTDVKLTQEQVNILDENDVLLLRHQMCGEHIRLWKEPQPDEVPP